MYIRFMHDFVFSLFLIFCCCFKRSSNANVDDSFYVEKILSHLAIFEPLHSFFSLQDVGKYIQKIQFFQWNEKFFLLNFSHFGGFIDKIQWWPDFRLCMWCYMSVCYATRQKHWMWYIVLMLMLDDDTKYQNLIYRLLYFTQRGEKFNINNAWMESTVYTLYLVSQTQDIDIYHMDTTLKMLLTWFCNIPSQVITNFVFNKYMNDAISIFFDFFRGFLNQHAVYGCNIFG